MFQLNKYVVVLRLLVLLNPSLNKYTVYYPLFRKLLFLFAAAYKSGMATARPNEASSVLLDTLFLMPAGIVSIMQSIASVAEITTFLTIPVTMQFLD